MINAAGCTSEVSGVIGKRCPLEPGIREAKSQVHETRDPLPATLTKASALGGCQIWMPSALKSAATSPSSRPGGEPADQSILIASRMLIEPEPLLVTARSACGPLNRRHDCSRVTPTAWFSLKTAVRVRECTNPRGGGVVDRRW